MRVSFDGASETTRHRRRRGAPWIRRGFRNEALVDNVDIAAVVFRRGSHINFLQGTSRDAYLFHATLRYSKQYVDAVSICDE